MASPQCAVNEEKSLRHDAIEDPAIRWAPAMGRPVAGARERDYFFGQVTPGKSSVRNGDAGNPALFQRLTTG